MKPKKKSDFLYNRMGPWPQPCPEHPCGEAPAVLHLPFKEAADWWLHIGTRYIKTLAYSPVAFLKGILKPGLEPVSDSDFQNFLTNSMITKFIKPDFDEQDMKAFGEHMKEGVDYFIVDLEPIKVVRPFKGIYVSPSKTLLIKNGEDYSVDCIYISSTDSIIRPEDGDNWELAKYFVLQGAALASTLVVHPLLHFPMDSINAVTKTSLPKDHILFKLLYPHLRFTLYLENAVLTFKSSLLHSKWWMSYAPYPGDYEGLRDLLVEGYKGIKENASYEAFTYPKRPEKVYGKYGEFQDAYFEVIKRFVANVLGSTESDDMYIRRWAKYVSHWVKGFPNSKEIFEGENLIDAVAFYIYDITIGHSVDHYDYGNMNIRKIPMRIRTAPPGKQPVTIDRKKLTTFWDYGKYEMARRLFFAPTNVTRLIDVNYNFKDPKLNQYVEQFKRELKELDVKMKKKGIAYIPLGEIAASIQY